MDSWYACQKLMFLIEDLGKIYYCPLKKNRLVDDTGEIENYKSKRKNGMERIRDSTRKIYKN
jgi:hypothetical protein